MAQFCTVLPETKTAATKKATHTVNKTLAVLTDEEAELESFTVLCRTFFFEKKNKKTVLS